MKKIVISLFLLMFLFQNSFADYKSDSISSFVNSVSESEINSIEDKKIRFCEKTFLRAYMRRDFTANENLICSDIFEQKIEAQINYMSYVLADRGIY